MANKNVYTPPGSHSDGQAGRPGTSSRARQNRSQAQAISGAIPSPDHYDFFARAPQKTPAPTPFAANANRSGRRADASNVKSAKAAKINPANPDGA